VELTARPCVVGRNGDSSGPYSVPVSNRNRCYHEPDANLAISSNVSAVSGGRFRRTTNSFGFAVVGQRPDYRVQSSGDLHNWKDGMEFSIGAKGHLNSLVTAIHTNRQCSSTRIHDRFYIPGHSALTFLRASIYSPRMRFATKRLKQLAGRPAKELGFGRRKLILIDSVWSDLSQYLPWPQTFCPARWVDHLLYWNVPIDEPGCTIPGHVLEETLAFHPLRSKTDALVVSTVVRCLQLLRNIPPHVGSAGAFGKGLAILFRSL